METSKLDIEKLRKILKYHVYTFLRGDLKIILLKSIKNKIMIQSVYRLKILSRKKYLVISDMLIISPILIQYCL